MNDIEIAFVSTIFLSSISVVLPTGIIGLFPSLSPVARARKQYIPRIMDNLVEPYKELPNLTQSALDMDGLSPNEIDLLFKLGPLSGVEDYLREEAIYFGNSDLQIPQTVPFRDLPDTTEQNAAMPIIPQMSTCAHPPTDDYPGPYNFDVELTKTNEEKVKWQFSNTLNKLFVVMNTIIPLKIKLNHVEPELYVRVLPIFLAQDSFAEPVKRCPTHVSNLEKSNQGFPYVDHIIRCHHKAATYHKNTQSGRLSVIVPTEPPQPGSDAFTVQYSFVCKNSCSLGMNRRSTAIILTLERQTGEVLGRKMINMRICCSPRRDRSKEEQGKNVENEITHYSQIVEGLEDQKIQREKSFKRPSELVDIRTPKKYLKTLREMILMGKAQRDLTEEDNTFLEEVNKHLH